MAGRKETREEWIARVDQDFLRLAVSLVLANVGTPFDKRYKRDRS